MPTLRSRILGALAVVLVGSCSAPPVTGSALRIAITLAPDLRSTCALLEVRATAAGQVLATSKGARTQGRMALTAVVYRDELPETVRVRAVGFSDVDCLLATVPAEVSEAKELTFKAGGVVDGSVTLARGTATTVDADNDGSPAGADCDDRDPQRKPGLAETCVDGKDNDCNQAIDCQDPACTGRQCRAPGSSCGPTGGCVEQTCSDGLDNDGDGPVDCSDPDCATSACANGGRCTGGGCVGAGTEVGLCGDGIDNDADTLVDCLDTDCDGQACNDSLACNVAETCGSRVCGGGAAVSCPRAANVCLFPAGTCAEPDGGCVYGFKATDAGCDDGLACTLGDSCDGDGGCAGTAVRACGSPPGPCFEATGVCDEALDGGCVYTIAVGQLGCSDSDGCTVNDACLPDAGCAGVPLDCSNATPPGECLVPANTCSNGQCNFIPRTGPCTGGTCSQGVCVIAGAGGGAAGGAAGSSGGGAAGGSAGGTAGGSAGGRAGGSAGGTGGGSAGGTAGGSAGGAAGVAGGTAGGNAGGTAGGSAGGTAGGSAGGTAGGSAGGMAGGSAGGTAGGSAGGMAGGSAGGTAGGSAGGAAGGAVDAGVPLPPSNFLLSALPATSGSTHFNLTCNATLRLGPISPSLTLTSSCFPPLPLPVLPAFTVIQQGSNLPDLVVLTTDRLTIAANVTLSVEPGPLAPSGGRVLAIAVKGNAVINGTINVSAFNNTFGWFSGAGGATGACPSPTNGATQSSQSGGGAGGSFGAVGGNGGRGADSGGVGGTSAGANGDPRLTPLRGGCVGSIGGGLGTPAGGTAGGAVQLWARDSLTVNGAVLALGGPGLAPDDFVFAIRNDGAGGQGAGSGGGILLEAPRVTIGNSAIIMANGGSGAQGRGSNNGGANGRAGSNTLTPAAGGSGGAQCGGLGGEGSARNGGPGPGGTGGVDPACGPSNLGGGGGGGGSVGRVRINALQPCTINTAARLSPQPTSSQPSCAP